ncbi:DNA polymerase III subunit gamma and tau, partial [Streptomyces sp. SID5614]|nr:DNA polymerase III subunit gamma and tau [Streptomyces sp. SID5614]
APQAPPAPAPESGQRPGSWPAAAGAGSGAGEQARRPGGWPTASAPGSGPAPAATPPPAAAPVAPAAPAAPAAPEGGQNMAQGAAQVRNMWPDILEAVKNRRRFTWILLSQNAQVAGFDGTTLQLGFLNAGARDNFASSGSEEVLKQALAERFNAQWRIEAVIDPSGGGGTPPQAGGGGGRPAPQYQPAPVAPAAPVAYEPRPQHAPPQQSAPAPQGQPAPSAQQPPPAAPPQGRDAAPAPEASRSAYGAEPPRPVSPEDDVPEDDDPDLVDSALSGHDLIVRELGATVIDEFANEQ